MPAWFVYVVRCRDGSLYTGVSTDVAARVATHNEGRGARYTRSRRPVTLVHVERKRDRGAALRREAAIKALPRAAKLAVIQAVPGAGAGRAPRRPRISGGGGKGSPGGRAPAPAPRPVHRSAPPGPAPRRTPSRP